MLGGSLAGHLLTFPVVTQRQGHREENTAGESGLRESHLETNEQVQGDRGLVLILLGAGMAESFSTALLIFAGLGASPSPLIIP